MQVPQLKRNTDRPAVMPLYSSATMWAALDAAAAATPALFCCLLIPCPRLVGDKENWVLSNNA